MYDGKISDLYLLVEQIKRRARVIPEYFKEFLRDLYVKVLDESFSGGFSFKPIERELIVSHPLRMPGEHIIPRRRVQRELRFLIPENTVGIDAGYLGSEGYSERDGIVSLASVMINRTGAVKKVRRSFLLPPGFSSQHLFLMGAMELELARYLMYWVSEGDLVPSGVIAWDKYGFNIEECFKTCFVDLRGVGDLIISLDRPLFPYYLWASRGRSKNVLIEAYRELYLAWEETRVPVYSVISASTQKSIISVILEMINGDRKSKGSQLIIEFLRDWALRNKEQALDLLRTYLDKADGLEEFYGYPQNQDSLIALLFGFLVEKLKDGSPYLKDVDVFDFSRFLYGDRSTAWLLNDAGPRDQGPISFVSRLSGSAIPGFFYVFFGKNYSRLEFLSDDVESIYRHFLFFSSFTSFNYPLQLELSHKVAVMDKRLKDAYLSLLSRFTGSVAGSKVLSKERIGGMSFGKYW